MTRKVTEDDVHHSLELYNLLQICQAAAQQLGDLIETDPKAKNLAGALPGALDLGIEKFWHGHDALERACDHGVSPAEADEPPAD